MDGIILKIKRRKAIQNKLVTAISNGKDIKSIQQEWLLEYIIAFFKERSDRKKWWNYTQKELTAQLIEQGLPSGSITDKSSQGMRPSYYDRDGFMSEHYEMKFQNYQVNFSNYRGGNAEGSYRGIHARFFAFYNSIDLRFMPKEMAATTLMDIDMLIPQWIEKMWPEFMLEAQKTAKKKSINENTIDTLLKVKLSDSDIKYHIEKQSARVKVYFNIDNKMQLEWFLPHKSFMEQIDIVIEAVKTIKGTVEHTGSTFTAKKLDKDINWQ